MWKRLYGCAAEGERQVFSDSTTTCRALCGARKEQLELCAMRGVGHDLNTPYQGYPFTLAWCARAARRAAWGGCAAAARTACTTPCGRGRHGRTQMGAPRTNACSLLALPPTPHTGIS